MSTWRCVLCGLSGFGRTEQSAQAAWLAHYLDSHMERH